MDTDRVFDHVVKDHNLVNGGIEEELQIAAKLGQELLLQNDAIRERNTILWQSNEEKSKEIEMLRQQNKALRAEAESKAADQMELEGKAADFQQKTKLMEKELAEMQALLGSMGKSMCETEKLYDEESRRAESLAEKVAELEKQRSPNSCRRVLSPTSPHADRRRNSWTDLQTILSRSEEKRRGLENEISNLLEENVELYRKLRLFEDYLAQHQCDSANTTPLDLSVLSNTTLDSTFESEHSECSTLESLTSESWLAEKLSALEDRYNKACDNCICGACEPICSDKDSGELTQLSYQELFDQLFDAIHSSRIRTPRGTLKRKAKVAS